MTAAIATRELEAELVDGKVRVLCLENLFTLTRRDFEVDEGQTLGEIVRALNLPYWGDALVSLDGDPIERKWWDRVRPKKDHIVTIRAIPRGGGGGGGNKGWIQLMAGIVLMVVAIVLIWVYGTGAAIFPYALSMLTAGIGMSVSGIITLVLPPPQLPKLKDRSHSDQPVFSITGSRNQANPWGAVPQPYGTHRIFPPFGALPYTQIIGNTQYLHQVFVMYGPCDISEMKIGDTPIENFQEIETEIVNGAAPLTLFPNSVFEDLVGATLGMDQGVEPEPVRVTHGLVDELSVDIVYVSGLYAIDGDGRIAVVSNRVRAWYRVQGDTNWIVWFDKSYSAATLQPLRRSERLVPPARGIYEVKLRQAVGANGSGQPGGVQNLAQWAILRSTVNEDPIRMDGLTKIGMRAKATDQFNGVVDQFNCIVKSILPDYDVGTDTWITRATDNPASIYRDVLQGTANARPLPDSRLDLAALEAWHGECLAAGRTFSFIVEQPTTVAELLRQIVAVGRATVGSADGTFGVIRDLPQTVPVQHFTPRNSRNFSGAKVFRDLPQGIKARFINPAVGWDIDERMVLDDGYSIDNGDGLGPVDAFGNPAPDLTPATKLESIQFFGVTSPDQAWKEARYHLAAAKLRPEVYTFETDLEHLVCTRGDMIRITHDVPLFGIGAGRIKSVTVDGSNNTTAIVVDEKLPMVGDGTRYSVRIRKSNAGSVTAEVVAVAGLQTTLTLVTPIAHVVSPDVDPAPGDIFMFGTLGEESVEAVVSRIEMTTDLGARISCVDAAPNIADADTGPIPPHVSHITRRPELAALVIATPIIDDVRSDESVLVRSLDGSLASRILIFLRFTSGYLQQPEFIEVRYRDKNAGVDWSQLRSPVSGDATQVSIAPVEDRLTYEIMLRAVNLTTGAASPWVTIDSHTVVGKTTPPPAPTALYLSEGKLVWSYPNPPSDFLGFVVRRTPA
jgi:Putative phage tail protein